MVVKHRIKRVFHELKQVGCGLIFDHHPCNITFETYDREPGFAYDNVAIRIPAHTGRRIVHVCQCCGLEYTNYSKVLLR